MFFWSGRIKVIILIFIINVTIFAAHEMSFDQVMSLKSSPIIHNKIDLSLYISKKSQWKLKEIEDRLNEANTALKSCDVALRYAYIHSWIPSNKLLRVDDYISEEKFYDGVRHASVQSKKITPIQFFYFEDYLESFTSGPSVPFAIYPNSKIWPVSFDSAWFPYLSAQRKKNEGLRYNEEAHELGHILLQTGHDHSGDSNIMANNSEIRKLHFSKKQCAVIRNYFNNRQDIKSQLSPIFSTYYKTYKKDFYMTDWCSRNTINLGRAIDRHFNFDNFNAQAVYVTSKVEGNSFRPLKARKGDVGWKFHAFLLIEGYVFDLDYSKSPVILPLTDYLNEMFGDELDELQFQLRSPLDSPGYTYLEVVKGFKSGKYKVLNAENLKKL